jgi:hypothetical protein
MLDIEINTSKESIKTQKEVYKEKVIIEMEIINDY